MSEQDERQPARPPDRVCLPLRALFRLALLQQLRTKRILLTLLVLVLPLLLTLYWALGTGAQRHVQDLWGILFITMFLQGVIPFIALLHAATVVRGEAEEGTLTYLVTRPVPRWLIALSKYLAVLVVTGIGIGLSVVACFFLLAIREGIGPVLELTGWLWRALGVAGTGLMLYSAIFFLIGVMTRRPIVVGFIFIVVWETFVGYLPGTIRFMTAVHYLRSLFMKWIDATVPGLIVVDPIPFAASWGVIAGLWAVCLVSALMLFARSEFRAEVTTT